MPVPSTTSFVIMQLVMLSSDGISYMVSIMIPSIIERKPLAPVCRQFGSSRTDDLVIAAHNYENHFGRLKELSEGDTVIFTDMEGVVNTYSVKKIETLNPNEVDAVQNSGYALVLYTCTKGGKTRVTVFCDRVKVITPSPSPTQVEK